MYHPGKVVAVLSPSDKGVESSDSSVQAVLRMWDENVLTMAVSPPLAAKVKEGDMVLVDYRPTRGMSVPVPNHVVVKILRGKAADKVWHEYREVYDKRRKSERGDKQASQSYIG
jgi:cytosine/adenosine deaminase-related metal-dependent hydrolase